LKLEIIAVRLKKAISIANMINAPNIFFIMIYKIYPLLTMRNQ
jgi:hypothetical protein